MEQGQQLSEFLNAIVKDSRISPLHISIYAALLHLYTANNFSDPIAVYSYEIMRIAKISTRYTCLKGIKELNEFGYICFRPTRNKMARSKIFLNWE